MPAPDRKRRLTAFLVALAVLIATPLAVVAADAFTDVPDSNVFHDDIAWLADANVTRGCNPPDNTEFCPGDNVTREQMAAFMRRLAQYIDAEDGTPAQADNATTADNADTLDGMDSVDLMTSVDGTSRNTEVGTVNLVPLAASGDIDLATLQISSEYGSHVLATFGFWALTSGDGRLAAWVQLDNEDCTLTPPYDQIYDGSLVIQDYLTGEGTVSLSSSIVLPTAGDPTVTLCARSVSQPVSVGESTLNLVHGNTGSSDVVNAGQVGSGGASNLLTP
jgi:hypothetical protein